MPWPVWEPETISINTQNFQFLNNKYIWTGRRPLHHRPRQNLFYKGRDSLPKTLVNFLFAQKYLLQNPVAPAPAPAWAVFIHNAWAVTG